MTDNKKYIINIGDHSEEWTPDMYAEAADGLFADHKDANVFELEDVEDFDEDPTNRQYIINIGDHSEVWDGDMVKEAGASLKEEHPDVRIQRVFDKDYWGERATANREQRAQLLLPDADRNARLAELGYYDDLSENQLEFGMDTNLGFGLKPLSSAIETSVVTGQTKYLDPAVQEFFANDSAYTDRMAEIARLDAEYESNPAVIAQREWEAQWRAEQAKYNAEYRGNLQGEIDALETTVDASKAGRGDAGKRMSPKYGMSAYVPTAEEMAESEKRAKLVAARTFLEKANIADQSAGKGFWGAAGDTAKGWALDSATQGDVDTYNKIGDILTNLEKDLGGLGEEQLTDEVLEQYLSPEDKLLILSFFNYNEAMANAQVDMKRAYKAGKIFAESVPFMLEFLVTGGFASAGSAATKGTTKAIEKGIAKALVKWVTKKSAKKATRMAVARGLQKTATGLMGAATGTLARTLASHGTYNRMAEESVKIEGGHLHRGKNAFKAFADAYIENLSEISGGVIGKTLGNFGVNPSKWLGKISFGKVGQLLADNRLAQGIAKGIKGIFGEKGVLKKFGFNGIFEEVEEEYIGNLIREYTIQDGALAEMHKDDNFGAMLIGFAPMTLFGAGISAVQMGAVNIEAANLGKKLRETLGYHYSEEQINHMMNLVEKAENGDQVAQAINTLEGLNQEEAQQLWQYGAFMAQNKAMIFARKAQEDNLAQAKRAEYQQQFGNFWQTSEDGAESVQIAELRDGRTVFVTSAPNENGTVAIIDAKTGKLGFSNVSEYVEQKDKDGNTSPMTRTWSMDAFLESQIARDRMTAQEARMTREYNEQVQNLQSQITSGTKINLGTTGNPIWMVATGQTSKDGVFAVDSTGATHTIGWMQVADAMNQPIRVKTDQEIIDEEVAAVVARNAERRKKMRNATPAMTDAVNESAAQTAEVVAQESKHIPMNEDGTVNEAAFWEQDPEGYAAWNDEQNQDGGADTREQIAISKAMLAQMLNDAVAQQQTSNPVVRKQAKKNAEEIQAQIDKLTALEAKYEEQRIAPFRERAMKWKGLTNAPVHIIETEEELVKISAEAAEASGKKSRVRGMAKDGKAYIYLPGITEASEIDAVFMHEAVAHTGLKGMLGQQAFDELCDQVWEMMSPEARQVFIGYPGVNGNKRAAADEYIAHIAEAMGAGVATEEEKTVWQQIIDFVRNVLRSMGITLNVSESELSDLIHMAYADLARNMAEAENIAAQQKEARAAEQNAPSAARQEYNTYAEDLTHDEIKAVAENDFTAAQQAYDALVGSAPRVEAGESAKDFIARKKAYNEQVAEAKAALDARQALMDEIAKIDAANAPVLTDAEVLEQEGLGVDTKNDDVRMSVRYVPTEKQREMIIGSIMNVTGRTREEAERWLASETSLAAMINEDLQYLDYVADPKYKAIKDNSDYPQGTVDFNNICRKRLPFTRMFTRLQRRFPNRVFTAEELADIRTIMSKDDLMVACGLCYVEDRRQMVGEVAQSFIDGLQEKFKTYANNPTKKKNAKKFNELIAGDTYVPQVYDLTTQEGLDKLYNEHRGIWEAFQAFNNARGQQSQNLLQGYAEYKREILSWSDKKVKSVNDNGGLRIFSYSDFEAHHLIDVVQIIIDCAAKGVKIQGYTKVPEFARAVANTGIKLNRSLIPLGDTGLVDGQLAFDPVEGIDINDPNFLESNDNVGNILIGINDEQIRIAMADPRIHYIIPYHARQKENIRQKLNVGAWTNYISTQNERNISDGKRVKDNINIYTDILTGDVTTDRQFVEKYLQLCKEKGRIPKFDQFLERDAEGNYLYTPGYYKFLVDFKLFDENGNILPQQPVVAEFDDAFNMQILENYAKDERESTGEQMNETYDKIVDALGLDESAAEGEGVRFSATEARELLDAMQAGAEILVPRILTEDVWKNEIEGRFFTSPIGEVKFGENQYDKNVGKERSREFGMLIPTIERPDLIFEEYDPKEGAERQTKYVFVKTFLDEAGEKHINYASVSVRQEGMEVVTSSHRLRDKQVLNKIEKEQMLWNRFASDSTSSAQGGSTDQSNALSDSKDSENLETPSDVARFSARTDEQREALFDKAKAQFGLTNNFKVAGYMLPDGSLLDFSEANDGGDPNQRSLDHREIEGIIMDEGKEYDSRWMYLADFMNEGAIRLLPEYAGINLMKAPTKEQRSRLFDFIYKYNGEVILEIADERLNNVAYVEYDRRTSPSRIFRDIDGYFNEGIVPQQDVRFSVVEPHNATMDEIDGLFREYNMDESLTPLYDKVSALAHSMDLKIRFDYPWSAAAGSTFGDKVKFNTEFFNSLAYTSQDKAHALLHEMIHATTNYAIAARNTGALTEGMKEAVSQLEGIYGEIVNDRSFDGTYGARSIYEMVAELSNPGFRSLLKEKNLFQRIVDAIKRLLGIEVGENALDNLSATLDYMLDNYDGRVFGAVVNQYQKHQEYTRFSAVQIDPAVRQEMDAIKAKAMWDGTFMKAPNGADTKLTEDQWLMVRTKNFINWFGDWINDPESASKVVDPETREPRVMYHGSAWHPLTEPKGNAVFRMRTGLLGRGAYFASSIEEATLYAEIATDIDVAIEGNYEILQDEYVTDYFLNIRNTEDIRDFGREDIIAVAKSPSQIKSATDTTGEFSERGDIRYSSRFDVDPNPTEAQKKAGNYKMGHLRLDGYNITIENPKGSVRRGTDSNGNEWENTLNNDYGYIRGTEGVDGDHIDVYLSDNPAEGNVFVIDQVNPETREFDEHKVMYGFNSIDEAREAYLANFSEGWNGLGTITEVTKDEFRKWIDSSHRKTKPFSEYKSVKTDILDEGDIRYSVVTDPALLERLDSEPTIKVYRAMQLIDGKLYPPMSAKVDGKMREPIELGKWEQAEERPDLADEKGYFKLDKGNKTSLKARYNPYFHTSPTPLNDQFSSAQTRPELVTVEVEVPESELTSGYKAEKAKDSVGQMEWKAGVVQSKLSGTRTVILSRWDKPIRIVPDSEVADKIVEMFDGKDITMPSNVVTPSLRAELESRGIPFVETDNNGKPVEVDTRYSVLSTPTDEVVAEGMKFSIQDFARLAGNIFQDMPESFRKEAIEETFKRGWDMQSAIFQIPARLAEKENWDESDKELAKVIREKVQDAMDESGVVMSRPLTAKEALWMLYRSTEANGDSMMDAAKRSIVAHNLGFDSRSMALKEKADDYIRYSVVRNGQIDAATDMYNYEANLWTNRLKESWLDMNQSVIALQNALADASGKPIASWENVVLALNQLSSKSYAEKKKYLRDYLMPLWNQIIEITKESGLSIEQIERYMMLKHGIERNKKFAMRDAKQFYREMYDKVADRMKNTSHAEQVVALSEANKRIADIDAQIAAASGKKLKDLQEARERAVVEKEIAELVLRNDEQQNEADLQMYYDAIEAENNPKYAEFREKDYGGLTSMFMDQIADVKRSDYKTDEAYQAALLESVKPRFDKIADMESEAYMEVKDYESKADMPSLWKLVNAATKETLRHQHAAGVITTEQYDTVRNMFDYYVPLRGFADNTAEDMYSYYMNNSAGGFAKPIIAAKGRKTRAESPLGWIGTMAESAIQQDNKNEVKMKLYYALMNRPDTGVLSLSEMWYVYDHTDPNTGKKVFVPAYPPATGGVLTADQMRQHMDAWEQSMKAKQAIGEAYKREQGVNLGGSVIFQDKAQDVEHIIRVKVAGKDYAILVNGNPRAAQAINGLLNPDANEGPVWQWYGKLRRGMSALMTSFSPLFWVSNYQRDLLSSFMRTSLNEGWGQAFKYLGNRFHGWKAAKYIYKYDNGTMGDSYYENLYKEFAENGGITGYTSLTTNKEYEKLLADYAKNVDKEMLNWIKGVWDKFMGVGEAIEQVSRFAAYITARESGKSIEEAVAAAKEVSVNFNRKGSAKPISLDELEKLRDKNGNELSAPKKLMAIVFSAMPYGMKQLYFFFNASIQALSSSAKLARKSPSKAMAWAGMYMGLSVGLAFLNYLLAGDDDDNDYLDLPDYLRHSTALFKMGDNYYFKWSLPQEMRPFYATADILVSKIMGKTPHKTAWNTVGDIALAAAEWLPVNPFGTEDPLLALVPDVAAPFMEIRENQNSFGGKIYNDMPFVSEDVAKQIPAYRKGTSKTGEIYVDMAEFLNDITGGDEVQKGIINLNPAMVEHLVEGYGGGIYDFGKLIVGIPGLIYDAVWGEGVEVREIPFVNKVLLSTDETNMNSHVNEAFYYYRGISENAERVENEYRQSDDPSRADDYRKEDDWRIHMLFRQYEEDLKMADEKVKKAVDDTEKDLALQEQNIIREMLLNDIASGKSPDLTTEVRMAIKHLKKKVSDDMKPARDADKKRLERKRAGDPDGMLEAIQLRDSLKAEPRYQRAEAMKNLIKEIEDDMEAIGAAGNASQRDSLLGELQKKYEALMQKAAEEIE